MAVPFRSSRVTPARPSMLDVAVRVFAADAAASLADVARAAGIGRTTLHKRYPRRQDLLVAIAERALDALERATAHALAGADGREPDATMRLLVDAWVPLGADLTFLLRQPSLDAETALNERWEALDRPVAAFVRDAQARGALRPDVPVYWIVSSLYALLSIAWEGVAGGELSRAEAPGLVLDGLLHGVGTGTRAVR